MIAKVTFHAFVILLFLQSCSGARSKPFPIGVNIEEFRSSLPVSIDSREIVGLYHAEIDYDADSISGKIDSVYRIGPFMYAGKPALLIARIKDNIVYQYDIVFTRYDHMIKICRTIYSKSAQKRHPDPTEWYWSDFANRGYSTVEELNLLKKYLIDTFSLPNHIEGDTTMVWTNNGISLVSRNNTTATIVSFYDKNVGRDYTNEWQFYALYDEANLLKIPLSIKLSDLRKYQGVVDTFRYAQKSTDSTIVQASLKSWGIVGKLTLHFDKEQVLQKIQWQPQNTGDVSMVGVFENIANFIGESLRKTHRAIAKSNNGEIYIRSWESEQERIVMDYDYSLLQVKFIRSFK